MSQAEIHPENPMRLSHPTVLLGKSTTASGWKSAQTRNMQPTQDLSETRALTAAIASGNPEALAVCYHTYFKFMFDEALRTQSTSSRVSEAHEAPALDIVQDAFLRIIKSLRVPLENEAQLKAYLRRTIYSVAIDQLRATSRRQHRHQQVAQTEQLSEPDDQANAQKLDWLNQQIKTLDDHQSNLMLMRYRFNWTLEKIGSALGLSPGAVDGRINRILNRLKKNALEDFHHDE